MTDAIKRAAEAMEDTALSLIGTDLGTIYRDDIARAALTAALDRDELARMLFEGGPMPDGAWDDLVAGGHYAEGSPVGRALQRADIVINGLLGGEA